MEDPTAGFSDQDPPPRRPGSSQTPSTRPNAALVAEFFDHVPATVWMTDDQMVITFAQGKLLRVLQVDQDRLVGRRLTDVLLDGREDHPLVQAHLTALGGHETSLRIEWGGRVYSARVAPRHGADGRITGCAGVYQEIAWMPDDEGTLRESDIRLRRVIDSNMIGIAFGDDEGRITDANDAFLSLAGYEREDLTTDAVSWPALMPIEAHQRQIQALEEILATGRCAPFETEIIRRNGERVPVLIGAARLSARRREGVAFVLDITDRKRTGARLKVELACADALTEATTTPEAAAALLDVLRDGLAWDAASMWLATSEGPQLAVYRGRKPHPTDDLVARLHLTLATRELAWWPEEEVLMLPLQGSAAVLGVLLLTGRPDRTRDGELVQTCRRSADRLARFMDRH